MSFAYICTNYNNTHFTRTAVESLLDADAPPEQIVVVDNASRPEEVAALKAIAHDYPIVDLVLNDHNVGYFPGLNIGISRSKSVRPSIDYLVIGNNDLSFPKNFGSQIALALPALQDCPVVSPNMITLDGLHQNPHVITGLSRVREVIYDLYFSSPLLARLIRFAAAKTKGITDRSDESHHATGQFIYQGHGSCYILTPRFFQLFDELWAPTFLFGEEYFLSRQLAEKGVQVYYEPSIAIRHHCNGAIQDMPSKKTWELGRDAHRVYRQYVKPWHKQGKPVPGRN
jgi:GT2 family glycosyltransferase